LPAGSERYTEGPHSVFEEQVLFALFKRYAGEVAVEIGTALGYRSQLLLAAGFNSVYTVDVEPCKRQLPVGIAQIVGNSLTTTLPHMLYGTTDLVFIDGNHSRIHVAADTRLAHSLVRAGGIIIWHDVFVPFHQVKCWGNDPTGHIGKSEVAEFLHLDYPYTVNVYKGTTIGWLKVG